MARRIAGQKLSIKASEWNKLDALVRPVDKVAQVNNSFRDHVEAVGRNNSGETLEPGSPVFYNPGIVVDNASNVYHVRTRGFYTLKHAHWPVTTGEIANFVTNNHAYTRMGVVLDTIPNDGAGRFAIGGVVQIRIASSGRFVRPGKLSQTYKTKAYGDRWGYRVMGFNDELAMIDLDNFYAGPLLARTLTGGLAAGAVGEVEIYDESVSGWTITTDRYPAWTFPSSIVGQKNVLLNPVVDRWLALEIC